MRVKLQEDYALLHKQLSWLQISRTDCKSIGVKDDYSIDEFGKFETLCSRYSRGIDFLIRRIFRTLDEFEFENQGSLIDVVNNAHKRGFFEDVERLRLMKDLRNTISHEYIEDELVDLFEEVLEYSCDLIVIIENVMKYIETILEPHKE